MIGISKITNVMVSKEQMFTLSSSSVTTTGELQLACSEGQAKGESPSQNMSLNKLSNSAAGS